jgi:CheY-like chemotaxis protein
MEDISNWRLLVVDDEKDNIGVIKLVMEFHDVVVLTASSGDECLEILKHETPNMLLVDIRMPGMSGFELLQILRKHPTWPDMTVVAVTAQAMQGDRERIIEAGFDGYISKPIGAMTLVDDLRAIVQTKGKHDPA